MLPDIYSRRRQQESSKTIDLFVYDQIPDKVKGQTYIALQRLVDFQFTDRMGRSLSVILRKEDFWKEIIGKLIDEIGKPLPNLPSPFDELYDDNNYHHYFDNGYYESNERRVLNYLYSGTTSAEQFLDTIDLTLSALIDLEAQFNRRLASRPQDHFVSEAIKDFSKTINERFLEAGVGYQIEDSRIIRVDNLYAHKSIIIPALTLLNDPIFKEADKAFREAHKHYRNGDLKDCTTACCRSFEWMMKEICQAKGWEFKDNEVAESLVTTVRKHGLFGDEADKAFDGYISALKNGVPTLRNRNGGHANPDRPQYSAHYMLNITASSLILLKEAFRGLDQKEGALLSKIP